MVPGLPSPLRGKKKLAALTSFWVEAARKRATSAAPTDAAPILNADLGLLRLDCGTCSSCFVMTTSKDGATMKVHTNGVKLIRCQRGANYQAICYLAVTNFG